MTEQTAAVPAPGTDLRDIALALIDVPAGRRALDPDWVETLAAEFLEHPQRTPIDVLQVGERFELVAGGHRYAAKAKVGHADIRAVVWQRSDFRHHSQIKLVEIAENFMRRELSVLDRAFDVAAWREVYETVQGAVKRGGDRRSKSKSQLETLIGEDAVDAAAETFAAAFTVAAQRALGLSRANVFRSLKIAALGGTNRQRISLLPIANNQSELLVLVAQPAARQALIIDRLIDGAASVADAIAIIDDVAPELPLSPWERMSERFARLPPAHQHQFFSLHEDAILQWVADRKR
jgi:ParB family chromosome partitioning protein